MTMGYLTTAVTTGSAFGRVALTYRLRAALLLGALTVAGCARTRSAASSDMAPGDATLNRITPSERADGWTSLFDGRTLNGWRGLGYATVPPQWTVENGVIRKVFTGNGAKQADGQPLEGADLLTKKTYGDFEFAWEWKVTPGANSGVKYNVSEKLSTSMPPTHAAKGFEYQMLDDDRHPDGKLATHRAGALYDLIAPNEAKHLMPVGEWNSSRIVFVGNHGEHWLNGQKIVEFELGSAGMNAALAASKYRSIPGFAERRRGHIVLQDHDDEVFFRNLKIREIGGGRR